MLKLKKLIAGALLSASLTAPLPAYAADAAAPAPAAAEVVSAAAEKLPVEVMNKMNPEDYLALAEKTTAAEPSANVDFGCTLASPLGQAIAQVPGSYVISDPTSKAADGFRPKVIDPKTDKPEDNMFVMEGNLTFALRSFTQNSPGTTIPFYVRADKAVADIYTYNDEKKTWTHYQQNISDITKDSAEASSLEKAAADKAAKAISEIDVKKVVKDAPSTSETRSLSVEMDLRGLLDAVQKYNPQITIPEIKDPTVTKLQLQVDADRKTAHITRQAGDLTKLARYIAHAMVDNTATLDAMHKQMISTMVDTSTVQFEGRFSGYGEQKNIMIPTAALEAPVTAISAQKKDEKAETPAEEK